MSEPSPDVAAAASSRSRLAVNSLIAGYLGSLAIGLALHAWQLPGHNTLPGYFVVWDMFCNWTGYENRVRFIGEGESGRHYDLLAADIHSPRLHGSEHRAHYDYSGRHTPLVASRVAERSRHEPLTRIFVMEESWSKQFNLSPRLYEQTHGCRQPDRVVHRHLRGILAPNGRVLQTQASWFVCQQQEAMLANPALQGDAYRGRNLYTANPMASR